MIRSILLMCIGSLMIAAMPTHAQIGGWAPALLLVARMLQGLSVGGEYGASATYLSEIATPGRRGFYGSFHYGTIIAGQLLAVMLVTLLQQLLGDEAMAAWGWRMPFLAGAMGALIALLMRRGIRETMPRGQREQPLAGTVRAMTRYPRSVLMVMGFTAGGSLIFYTFTSYMQKYLVNTAQMGQKSASLVMTGALFLFMCAQPIFGLLSDRIGRRRQMIAYALFFIVGSVPILSALGRARDAWSAFWLVLLALLGMSLYTSISGLLKAELFPAGVRALGVGLPYGIANALFGGTAEYIALWLKSHHVEPYYFWYVTAFSAVILACSLLLPRAHVATPLDVDS